MSEKTLEEVLAGTLADHVDSRNQSRVDFVYNVLGSAIRTGRLTGGERVREEEIAQMLGVSRTPVREALRRLQSQGLLETTNGRGLGVVVMNRQQILELYEMREVLEGGAARLAARHASPSEVALLLELQEASEAAENDPLEMAAINRRFHHAIYDAAHNCYLLSALREVYDAMALLGATTFTFPGRGSLANEEHRVMLDAISGRDADAAEQATRRHIERAKETRLKMLLPR